MYLYDASDCVRLIAFEERYSQAINVNFDCWTLRLQYLSLSVYTTLFMKPTKRAVSDQ